LNDLADFMNAQAFHVWFARHIVLLDQIEKENGMKGIEGKVVVITGASSGIGEATALLLAERGAKVVLGARGSDRLKALADRIAASGGEVAYIQTDVKRREDLSNLVGLAIERYGKLDVLINNAGVAPISLLDELRVEDWEEMIDINLKGVLYGIAAALPIFRRQGFGTFRQRHFHSRNSNQSDHGGLCRHEERRAHHHRGFAAGSRREAARDRHFAGVRSGRTSRTP
jgi:NAD(P)-dependent dehydrogenase (short-subunit alcohol dehydrogenase family)